MIKEDYIKIRYIRKNNKVSCGPITSNLHESGDDWNLVIH